MALQVSQKTSSYRHDYVGRGVMDDNEELEEGEAGYESNYCSDLNFPEIDDKLTEFLGHIRKDFEGTVFAEKLGSMHGNYGSFLPTEVRAPSVFAPQSGAANGLGRKSPLTKPSFMLTANGRRSPDIPPKRMSVNPPLPPHTVTTTATTAASPPRESGVNKMVNVPSHSKPTEVSGEGKKKTSLNIRIKMGPNSRGKNTAIYNGLGFSSPSLEDDTEDEDEVASDADTSPERSPASMIETILSCRYPASGLLSPLPDLLSGIEDDKNRRMIGKVETAAKEAKQQHKSVQKEKLKSKDRSDVAAVDSLRTVRNDSSERREKERTEVNHMEAKTSESGKRSGQAIMEDGHKLSGRTQETCAPRKPTKRDIIEATREVSRVSQKEVSSYDSVAAKESSSQLADKPVRRKLNEMDSERAKKKHKSSKYADELEPPKESPKRKLAEPSVEKTKKKHKPGKDVVQIDVSNEGKNKIRSSKYPAASSGSYGQEDFSEKVREKDSSKKDKKEKSGKLGPGDSYEHCRFSNELDMDDSGAGPSRDRSKLRKDVALKTTKKSKDPDVPVRESLPVSDVTGSRLSQPASNPILTADAPVQPPPIFVLDNWAQCDKCQQWRLLHPNIDPDKLPKRWLCKMITWLADGMNDCRLTEDETTNAVYSSLGYVNPNPPPQQDNVAAAPVQISVAPLPPAAVGIPETKQIMLDNTRQ